MNHQPQPNNLNPFAGLTMKAGGAEPVPAGQYWCDFLGVDVPPPNPAFDGKPKLRWRWKVSTGPQQGRELSAISDLDFSPGNKAGRFLSGTIGRQPAPGEPLDAVGAEVQSRVGKRFLVTQGKGPKSDKLSVQAVALPPEV
jgi:hypothetical protein